MEALLVIVTIIVLIRSIIWINDKAIKAKLYTKLKPKLDDIEAREVCFRQEQLGKIKNIEAREDQFIRTRSEKLKNFQIKEAEFQQEKLKKLKELEAREAKFRQEQLDWNKKIEAEKQIIETIAKEKSIGFPWLAQAYADYFSLKNLQLADYLESKAHPAKRAAEVLRKTTEKLRTAEKHWRVLDYQIKYYESLFPGLADLKEEGVDELIEQVVNKTSDSEPATSEENDAARHWLAKAEYESLPTDEKYQLALERYWKKNRSRWEVGRDYERYIGYQYETNGCQVYYQGAIEGLADLGRDLVAVHPNGCVEIVQCKYWSKEKTIHEKHIFQLYGTLTAYRFDNSKADATATLFTSTTLSDRAKNFAKLLDIKYFEKHPFQKYPCIKCNVSSRGKIYHLPFDQQYDRVAIDKKKMEYYVSTVKEAEALGFRRAFRWKGNNMNN